VVPFRCYKNNQDRSSVPLPPPPFLSSNSVVDVLPIAMTYGFLSKVVLLVLLSVSGVWAQFDMAECKPGREWVRSVTRFFPTDTRVNAAAEHPVFFFCGL